MTIYMTYIWHIYDYIYDIYMTCHWTCHIYVIYIVIYMSYIWHIYSHIYVIYIRPQVAHSYSIDRRVIWLIHMCDTTHSYVWRDSFTYTYTWLIHTGRAFVFDRQGAWCVDKTVTHVNESCRTYEWVMSHIQMGDITPTNELCHTYAWVMSQI